MRPTRVLVLGCGSVAQCTLPLLIRDLSIDPQRITIVDMVDNRARVADSIASGVAFEQRRSPRPTSMSSCRHVSGRGICCSIWRGTSTTPQSCNGAGRTVFSTSTPASRSGTRTATWHRPIRSTARSTSATWICGGASLARGAEGRLPISRQSAVHARGLGSVDHAQRLVPDVRRRRRWPRRGRSVAVRQLPHRLTSLDRQPTRRPVTLTFAPLAGRLVTMSAARTLLLLM